MISSEMLSRPEVWAGIGLLVLLVIAGGICVLDAFITRRWLRSSIPVREGEDWKIDGVDSLGKAKAVLEKQQEAPFAGREMRAEVESESKDCFAIKIIPASKEDRELLNKFPYPAGCISTGMYDDGSVGIVIHKEN